MGDYSRIGEAIDAAIKTMAVLLCVFVPFGLWKLLEVLAWVWNHVSFNF